MVRIGSISLGRRKSTRAAKLKEEQAAVQIQSVWRGHEARREVKEQQEAAQKIQEQYRKHKQAKDEQAAMCTGGGGSARTLDRKFISELRKQSAIQAFPLPTPARSNESRVYRSALCDEVEAGPSSNNSSLYELFISTSSKCADKPCIGWREGKGYQWMKHSRFIEKVKNTGSGLKNLGLQKGDRLGIYASTRHEWLQVDLACASQSIVTVAVYDTLGPKAAEYIINHADVHTVACSADKTIKLLQAGIKTLKCIIQFEPIGPEEMGLASHMKIGLLSLDDVENNGRAKVCTPTPPSSPDLYTIMYTSGTTGPPKGVMITHGNMVASLHGMSRQFQLLHNDIMIAYLPMAHVLERTNEYACLIHGGSIGFYSGVLSKLSDDIQTLRPTVMAGAPRVFERVARQIHEAVGASSGFKQKMWEAAYQHRKKAMLKGGSYTMLDGVIFKKVRMVLGGRIRALLSGGAPLQSNIQELLSVCLGAQVVQGYGLSESTAVVSCQFVYDPRPGHVGPPCVNTEIKLRDVPNMNYMTSSEPPYGEILVRGPSVFKGYYKDPELTKQVFTTDGWLETGDIGTIRADGTLQIVDRKKDIFKMQQGEYVSAEYLEGVYRNSKYVSNIFVHGVPLASFLVAVVVPVVDSLRKSLKSPSSCTDEEICRSADAIALIIEDLKRVGQEAKVKGYEKIRCVYLEPIPFAINADLVTATHKLRRGNLQNRYKGILDEMYNQGARVSNAGSSGSK